LRTIKISYGIERNTTEHEGLQGLWPILWCFQGKGTGSGHRTLLYGNAILLRHLNSDMVNCSSLW